MEYLHIKSGRVYEVKFFGVINATNAQDGQEMVIYEGMKKDGSGKALFVREVNEFNDKFKKPTQKEKPEYSKCPECGTNIQIWNCSCGDGHPY